MASYKEWHESIFYVFPQIQKRQMDKYKFHRFWWCSAIMTSLFFLGGGALTSKVWSQLCQWMHSISLRFLDKDSNNYCLNSKEPAHLMVKVPRYLKWHTFKVRGNPRSSISIILHTKIIKNFVHNNMCEGMKRLITFALIFFFSSKVHHQSRG